MKYLAMILTYWKSASILALLGTLWWGYNHYSTKIEILELKLTIAEQNEKRCTEKIEKQNQKIIDNSETMEKNVSESFETLEKMLNDISTKQREEIADILDETIPLADDCQGARDYLINMANRLRW